MGFDGLPWRNTGQSLTSFPGLDSGNILSTGESLISHSFFLCRRMGCHSGLGVRSLVWVFLDASSAPVSTVTHNLNSISSLSHTLSFPVPHVPTGEALFPSFHSTSSSPCLLMGGVRLSLGGENSLLCVISKST